MEGLTALLFFERKEASEKPWTKDLWIYDLRTNQHFTLKTNPLANKDLDDFQACYTGRDASPQASAKGKEAVVSSKQPYHRKETERFKKFTYAEIVESLEAALEEFRSVEEALTLKED